MQTEQKLEMIRRMRMEHCDNHSKIQRRANILYGNTKAEIQGERRTAFFDEAYPTNPYEETDAGGVYGSLRLRILAAIFLFLLFFFMDHYDLSLGSFTASRVMEQLEVSLELPGSFSELLP